MLKDLFSKVRVSLNSFLDSVNAAHVEKLLHLLAGCKGLLIFTGVGKSGFVAQKIAMTMTSCGTRALFLSPTNALHGDIGIVTKEDILVVFSKSGESDELLQLIPAFRAKQAKVVSIVNNEKSRLAHSSDFVLALPAQPELCPFDMAPTTSSLTQMMIGDVLTVGLMELKQFSLDQYAINHPAGRIGRRITLRVRDLMIKEQAIPLCSPTDKLVDTLVELSQKRCGCVLVSNDKRELLGIFTDGDLRRALQKQGAVILNAPMQQLMTPTARLIHSEALVSHALEMMEGNQKSAVTVLPVIDANQIVGLIKLHDIVQSGI